LTYVKYVIIFACCFALDFVIFQMLRDMLTVNELTNWNVRASIEAKYRALKCHIKTLNASTPEFQTIVDLIQSSTDECGEF
jgi:hypothetical protein